MAKTNKEKKNITKSDLEQKFKVLILSSIVKNKSQGFECHCDEIIKVLILMKFQWKL